MSDPKLNETKPKLKALLFHDDLEFVTQGLQLVESLSVSEKSFLEILKLFAGKKLPKRIRYDFLEKTFSTAEHSVYVALTFLGLLALHKDGSHIRKLILQIEGLSSLPSSIGHLTDLRVLRLYDGELRSLPDTIRNLRSLEILIVNPDTLISAECFLQSFPTSLEGLTQLRELDLSGNEIKSLPETIGDFTKLTHLNLVGCDLSSIPEGFTNLENLLEVNLSHNNLTLLPKNLENLRQLQYLELVENSFSEMEKQRISEALPDCDIRF